MATSNPDIYAGHDPLDVPTYAVMEVAHCLRVPAATVRAWALGRSYPSSTGAKRAKPLIRIADKAMPSLSFRNLVELHVLSAIRRTHKVQMPAVRRAVDYLRKELQIERPLADQQMTTDGKDLFIERYGKLLNISRGGQLEMKDLVAVYLSRVDRNPRGVPIRLFPFTRPRIEDSPKFVAINPRIQFGRPCIARTGIPTSEVAERYQAGDSVEELAKDYGQETLNIEESLRYECQFSAA